MRLIKYWVGTHSNKLTDDQSGGLLSSEVIRPGYRHASPDDLVRQITNCWRPCPLRRLKGIKWSACENLSFCYIDSVQVLHMMQLTSYPHI